MTAEVLSTFHLVRVGSHSYAIFVHHILSGVKFPGPFLIHNGSPNAFGTGSTDRRVRRERKRSPLGEVHAWIPSTVLSLAKRTGSIGDGYGSHIELEGELRVDVHAVGWRGQRAKLLTTHLCVPFRHLSRAEGVGICIIPETSRGRRCVINAGRFYHDDVTRLLD